ncbi:TraA family conjugative transfer protein [Vibrio coralliilyticus]|uniref:Pili assembly chaperone n=1 Tax=Vibrio coralliilyticus TaxID=190893 RepID=A0AAP7DEK4_9VIBR|nr:TraA family conjugative transfer protein [Vibrio coralliilyticus]NOI31839.1 hypothetical protein [Vibrio coralliilyticus]NOJ25283.1 hypothetical protein [Vibrio coralliilyticus]
MTLNPTEFALSEDAKMKIQLALSLVALAVVMSAMAQAGTDTTFDGLADQFEAWLKGSYGKAVSLAIVIVGIIGAAMKSSLMPFALGIGCAVGMNYVPDIIDAMFTATL